LPAKSSRIRVFLSNCIKPLKVENNEDTQAQNEQNDEIKKEETNDFDAKFEALSADNKLIYGFLSTLLCVSSSSLPMKVSDIYQRMRANDKVPQFKALDVKQTSFSKLARFAQSQTLETFIAIKVEKSKIFIESMQSAAIAKHLLLTLNGINIGASECIMAWLEANWQSDDKSKQFEIFYDGKDFDLGMDASEVLNILFGDGMDDASTAANAMLNHLSDSFGVILSERASEHQPNLQSADDIFRCQFLQTLKVSVDPKTLPIAASTLLTRQKLFILKPKFVFSKRNLLKVSMERDIISSVKQTSWKKSSKFLRHLAKKNILKLKDCTANGGELMICSLNFSFLANTFNADGTMQFFTPSAFQKFADKIKELQAVQNMNSNAEMKENENEFFAKHGNEKQRKKISISTMYRANHRLLPIFGDVNISQLHSRNKARTFLWSWVSQQKLISSNKQNVRIDAALWHMLFDSKLFRNKLKNENDRIAAVQVDDSVHRKDLINLFDAYLAPHSAVILDEDETPKYKLGLPPKIEVKCDKRQGTKFMTHVQGLEVYGIEPSEFKETATKYFAAAVTVSNLKGKKAKMKGGGCAKMVSIQGNKVKDSDKMDVPTLLSECYGIPAQLIDAQTKITKQAKK